ncbi:hypothetical protein HDU83_004665 [Entophlyctis luteolus]|nr:hypothetical protein HDU83_004665 [Entophlyctis luteolus]
MSKKNKEPHSARDPPSSGSSQATTSIVYVPLNERLPTATAQRVAIASAVFTGCFFLPSTAYGLIAVARDIGYLVDIIVSAKFIHVIIMLASSFGFIFQVVSGSFILFGMNPWPHIYLRKNHRMIGTPAVVLFLISAVVGLALMASHVLNAVYYHSGFISQSFEVKNWNTGHTNFMPPEYGDLVLTGGGVVLTGSYAACCFIMGVMAARRKDISAHIRLMIRR